MNVSAKPVNSCRAGVSGGCSVCGGAARGRATARTRIRGRKRSRLPRRRKRRRRFGHSWPAGLKSDVAGGVSRGTYTLASPLVFTPADSGTPDHKIILRRGAGRESRDQRWPEITNWTASADESNKWTAELPGVKSGQWFFRQLITKWSAARCGRGGPMRMACCTIATVADEGESFTFDRALRRGISEARNTELVVL